jgi:hypothetical protein
MKISINFEFHGGSKLEPKDTPVFLQDLCSELNKLVECFCHKEGNIASFQIVEVGLQPQDLVGSTKEHEEEVVRFLVSCEQA